MKNDLGLIITEQLIYEINAVLAAPLTLPLVGPMGALAGAYSAGKSTEGNMRIVNNLANAMQYCPDEECVQKLQNKIDFYKSKVAGSSGSTTRRAIGGLVAGGFGAHLYHNHDRNKKVRDINRIVRSMKLNDALAACEQIPEEDERQTCINRVEVLKGKLRGKRVYRYKDY